MTARFSRRALIVGGGLLSRLALCSVAMLPLHARAAEARLRCVADTNLSSYSSERELNYGASSHLRLKGIEMMALLDFDTAPIKGWVVKRATLHLRYAGADRRLRTLGFSTVCARWQEGTGTGERKAGECCFDWRACGTERWAGPHSDFTDVTFTAGHTLAAYSDIVAQEDGWFTASVAPELVQAMLAGATHGLAVTDEKGQTSANNDVYSREQSGSEPYLVVVGEPGPTTPPKAFVSLTAAPDSRHAGFRSGAVQVTFTAPNDAFAFEVSEAEAGAKERETPHYEIPFARPGARQTLLLMRRRPGAALDALASGICPICVKF